MMFQWNFELITFGLILYWKYILFSPRPLVLLTSPLFLWKLAIFQKCSANFQDCITWLLNTICECLKRFYLKNRLIFSYSESFLLSCSCHFSYLLMMWSWWQNDDAVMKSGAKNLHVILFVLLQIIIWPVFNVIACSKLILSHFLLFKEFARKLGFFKIGLQFFSYN